MQVKFIKSDIVRALTNAALFLKKSPQQEFLQALWIKADADKLVLSATDSQAEYTATIPATVINSGLVGVNGKIFIDLVKRMENGEIIIKANKKMSVLQGKKRYTLPLMESSWYQENEKMPNNTVSIASDLFKEAIEKTAFCIHSDPDEEGINCLFIGCRDKEIKIVGMDGSMMAIQSLSNDALYNILDNDDVLINKKMVDELKRILPVNGQIELAVSDKRLFIGIDGEEIVSFPKSGHQYPDFMNLLEKYPTPLFTATLNRSDVVDALDRLSLFNTDLQSVQFDFQKNKVVLSNVGDLVGNALEELDCNIEKMSVIFPGKFLIMFNLPGLQKILKYFISEKVEFCFHGVNEPCFFKGNEDVGYMSLTMPIELDEVQYEEEETNK